MSRYLEFAMYLRQRLEERAISVGQARMLCGDDIPLSNWYQWLRGERVPCSWQLKKVEQRMNFSTPYKYLRGEDRYGAQIKTRQMALPGLKETNK